MGLRDQSWVVGSPKYVSVLRSNRPPFPQADLAVGYLLGTGALLLGIEARDWAWTQDTPSPAARLVLLCLAEHAQDGSGGHAYLGLAALSTLCQLNKATVARSLAQLRDRNLIVSKRTGGGRGQVTHHWLQLSHIATVANKYSCIDDTETVASTTETVASTTETVASTKREPIEPKEPKRSNRRSPGPPDYESLHKTFPLWTVAEIEERSEAPLTHKAKLKVIGPDFTAYVRNWLRDDYRKEHGNGQYRPTPKGEELSHTGGTGGAHDGHPNAFAGLT